MLPAKLANQIEVANGTLISIIIPALHRPDLTAKCIESIGRSHRSAGELEIVVVENAARPGAIYDRGNAANVRSLLLRENLGTTGSINRALSRLNAPYVLLLNNDVELTPGFLDRLRHALEQNPRAAFATGKLLDANRRGYLDGAGDALLMAGAAYRLGHGDADSGQFDSPASLISGCGAAVLFRRSVLDEVGGLDEQFFAYLDDLDLGLRAHLRGYTGLYVPTALASHVGSATLGNALHPKIVSWMTRNQLLLLLKDYPGSALLRLLPRILFYQFCWAARVAGRGTFVAYLKGLFKAVLALPQAVRDRSKRQRSRAITSGDFLRLLRDSERQVYTWHRSQPALSQSQLLKAYFGAFGAP